MKKLILEVLPNRVLQKAIEIKKLLNWRRSGFLENAPQFVKQNVFVKFGISGAQWVETGTYLGVTTNFLAKRYPKVYSIEPSLELFTRASKYFADKNVELFNDVSEIVLPSLLPTLEGNVNFWLDGHYSAGITFKGGKECPVEDELVCIQNNLAKFGKVVILIDDVRCFLDDADENTKDYPSIDYLVDWARMHNFNWRIEQDIFVMRNFSS